MPRKNRRDEKRDPREKKFLAGDPVDELYIKPLRRRDKWKRRNDNHEWLEEPTPTMDEDNDTDE